MLRLRLKDMFSFVLMSYLNGRCDAMERETCRSLQLLRLTTRISSPATSFHDKPDNSRRICHQFIVSVASRSRHLEALSEF